MFSPSVCSYIPAYGRHRTTEKYVMLSAIYVIAAVAATLLAVYLLVCLLTPEIL